MKIVGFKVISSLQEALKTTGAGMNPTLRHQLTNIVQSILLIGGMAGIAWVCASAIWGASVAIWAFLAIGLLLLITPSLQSDLILSIYRARPIRHQDYPEGVAILEILAERAGLDRLPDFYYLPSAMPNAFATRKKDGTAIAISDGLLRLLNQRELAAVLGHEISHIANRDLWIMGLADVLARLTTITSTIGQLLLILNLPLIIAGALHVPWTIPLVLVFSPTIMSLLQRALSRTREFDADLGAVRLTGDPAGLASALARLENAAGRFWEDVVFPGRRIPEPSLLRTHPHTEDRIARLRDLSPGAFSPRPILSRQALAPGWSRIASRPRWHRTGVWY